MAKIREEQFNNLNVLKAKFNELTFIIGQNKVQQKQLKDEEESLFEEFSKLIEEEQNLLSEIQKEYGDGNLDTNTGEFTPKVS